MVLTILYIVLIIAAVILTGFGAYALWNTALAMKQTRKTAASANKQLEKIDEAVTNATNAVNSVSRLVKRASDTLEQPMEGVMKGINIAQKIIHKFRDAGEPSPNYDCDDEGSKENQT